MRLLIFCLGLFGTTGLMVALGSTGRLPTGPAMLVAYLWMAVWTVGSRRWLREQPAAVAAPGDGRSRARSWPSTVITGVGWGLALFLLGGAAYALTQALGIPVEPPPGRPGPTPLLLAGFTAAAVTEEFAFRGVLQRRLIPMLGRRGSVVAQAVVFSLFHLSPGQLASTFVWGIVLGWVSLRDGDLRRAIVAHVVLNLAGLALFLLGG